VIRETYGENVALHVIEQAGRPSVAAERLADPNSVVTRMFRETARAVLDSARPAVAQGDIPLNGRAICLRLRGLVENCNDVLRAHDGGALEVTVPDPCAMVLAMCRQAAARAPSCSRRPVDSNGYVNETALAHQWSAYFNAVLSSFDRDTEAWGSIGTLRATVRDELRAQIGQERGHALSVNRERGMAVVGTPEIRVSAVELSSTIDRISVSGGTQIWRVRQLQQVVQHIVTLANGTQQARHVATETREDRAWEGFEEEPKAPLGAAIIKGAIGVGLSVLTAGALGSVFAGALGVSEVAGAALAVAGTNATMAAAQGGDAGDVAKAAFIGGITSSLGGGVAAAGLSKGATLAGNAFIGCTATTMQGGHPVAGAFTGLANGFNAVSNAPTLGGQVAVQATTGAIKSIATGQHFVVGAVEGATAAAASHVISQAKKGAERKQQPQASPPVPSPDEQEQQQQESQHRQPKPRRQQQSRSERVPPPPPKEEEEEGKG
jgi:hypothetical protein